MNRWPAALVLISVVWAGAQAAPKGPQVELIDNKLSVSADTIPLGRLLQLVDLATGMKSKVPPELANRNISVQFSGLSMTDAVRKMFQGQPLDYVVVQGQGIIVTAASQAGSGDSLPPFNPAPTAQQFDQPFVQEFAPVQGTPFQQQMQQQMQQQQPPMVQTPFGPIPNPNARGQNQVQPNSPLNIPGQQNSLFPQPSFPTNGQQPVQILPANQANPSPFGTVSPFGTPNVPNANPNNGLFGNVPVLNPGAPPR